MTSDSSSRTPGSPPPSPAVLQGKYELGRLLGHGTFGKVYVARDVRTGHNVAMKVVGKDKVLRVGMAEQVKREIAVMKMVTHPNIVELHEVLASKTRIYFAMELVRGGELFARIARHGRMKEDAARAYFKQLVSAVDFCHSRGVYHRDLKPENLLLDDAGNLKIADFGLSAFGDHLRPDGLLHTTCGTPAYVAPEVILKKGYDGAKADLWSCGVILYVLLAGFLPFQDDNLMALYKKIHRGDFKCPPWFSTEARRLVTKLLDPNPATRITVAKLVETPWFKKPVPKCLPQTLRLPDDDDVEVAEVNNCNNTNTHDSSCVGKANETAAAAGNNPNNNGSGTAVNSTTKTSHFIGGRWGKDKPESLNAFHIISLSEGFDLSPLFQGGRDKEDDMRFTTREPASEVISRLEEVAARAGGRFKVRNKTECGVRLEGVQRGRKGKLAVAAEMYNVAPSVLVVEVKKDAGDTLEYRTFCSNELRPALKDIMWACPEPPQQTTAAA